MKSAPCPPKGGYITFVCPLPFNNQKRIYSLHTNCYHIHAINGIKLTFHPKHPVTIGKSPKLGFEWLSGGHQHRKTLHCVCNA